MDDTQTNAPGPYTGQQFNMTPAIEQSMLGRAQTYLSQGDVTTAAKALPPDYTIDAKTGQIRPQTWWERNGETTKFLLTAAAGLGGAYFLQGLSVAQAADAATAPAGASGAAGVNAGMNVGGTAGGVGVGETGAVSGLSDSGFGGTTVPATSTVSQVGNLVPATTGGTSLANTALNAAGTASPLMKAIAALGGTSLGALINQSGQSTAVPSQLSDLLNIATQRANTQTPLFNAVNKGYYDMLPNFAKTGQPGGTGG
jgi:hypothetical protein